MNYHQKVFKEQRKRAEVESKLRRLGFAPHSDRRKKTWTKGSQEVKIMKIYLVFSMPLSLESPLLADTVRRGSQYRKILVSEFLKESFVLERTIREEKTGETIQAIESSPKLRKMLDKIDPEALNAWAYEE